MLLSAASLLLTVATSGSDLGDLTEQEMRAWKKIQPAIVYVMDGQRVRGTAALISKDGYFLTHATALGGKTIDAKKMDGTAIRLRQVTLDNPTQFALLKADEWSDSASPLSVAGLDSPSNRLLAITTTGPIRAERAKQMFGVVAPSNRLVPLQEVFLENNLPTLSGSLLFDLNGQLAGALNASLPMSNDQSVRANNVRGGASGPGGGGLRSGSGELVKSQANTQYGPGVLTAAFTIGPKVLQRVVNGFLSEDRVVRHPAIGVFCRDAMPQGALIDSVTEGSPADKAGLAKGDVIQQMNREPVRNLVDFSRIISNQEIGDSMTIVIRRNGLIQTISVTVGGAQAEA